MSATTEHTISVKKRFCGPPNSGNGGYTSGLIAKHIQGDVQVKLLLPPPLDTELKLEVGVDRATLFYQSTPIAQAQSAALDLQIPEPLTIAQAQSASAKYIPAKDHLLPTCFVCGPLRKPEDGLNIFTGPTDTPNKVAAVWQPFAELADENGVISKEYIWAALDCPGYFSINNYKKVALLGSMTASIKRPVLVDQSYVVQGWLIESEGRKHFTGTAIFDERGELFAASSQVWIQLKDKNA